MSLQEQLNAMKEKSEARIPTEALEVMHRATEELEKSGILDQVPKAGDRAPDFALHNPDLLPGRLVTLLQCGARLQLATRSPQPATSQRRSSRSVSRQSFRGASSFLSRESMIPPSMAKTICRAMAPEERSRLTSPDSWAAETTS
ncbi:MAG: hypothetical protein MUC41_17820 [Syntrophobacteraceae bacterium]|nr:hypothetical protein [Syntrophobacteraceae bacterium]